MLKILYTLNKSQDVSQHCCMKNQVIEIYERVYCWNTAMCNWNHDENKIERIILCESGQENETEEEVVDKVLFSFKF